MNNCFIDIRSTVLSVQRTNILPLFLFCTFLLSCGVHKKSIPATSDSFVDSILTANDFNGVVLISKDDRIVNQRAQGFSDLELNTKITLNDQFVIGSISKQITAVLVLLEMEKGNLKLTDTISKYLPDLHQDWAQRVSIHHLLTHTHGIMELDEPQEFREGTKFQYSQIGYHLLSMILEKLNHQSFETISMNFFRSKNLMHTFHPSAIGYSRLVKGYEELENGNLEYQTSSLSPYPAAGAFISTASDLLRWNQLLHSNQLVKKETMELMKTKYAVRDHSIFGPVNYGYGLLFMEGEQSLQIGALGYAPGFASACYYYPQTNEQVIVLSNVARNLDDFKETFRIHTEIMEYVKVHSH
ncbi:MAG: serine hydrolase domain-containing protein [Crocinitomicaceae bacterium]